MTPVPSVPCPRSTAVRWGAILALVLAVSAFLASAGPAFAVGCLTQEMNQRFTGDRSIQQGAARTHVPGDPQDPMSPPVNPQVGDSWLWKLWYFVGGPPHYINTMCTVRGMGANVYVIVEDASWGTYVDQTDVDNVVAAFETHSYGNWPDQGIWQLNTSNFGMPPDMLDNDPRIYLVLYNWDTSQADGYWNVGDEFPDSAGNPSNECECVYVDASTSDPGGPGGAYLTAVMGHEFEHMIHWAHDSNELPWVDEGMAEFSMWLYGRPDTITSFPGAPDNCLLDFTSSTADYIKCYLFSLYYYEHFGGTPAVLALVENDLNSWQGYESTMQAMGYTTTFAQLMADWTTANFLDNPNLEGGRYNYAGATLPVFASVTKSSYPVPVTSAMVDNFAADYVKFINGQPQQVNFDGADNSLFHIRLIKYLTGAPLSVEDMILNSAQAGAGYLFTFGTDYDQVVMVVTNVAAGTSPISYQYSTQSIPAAVEPGAIASNGLRLEELGANPSRSGASLRLVLGSEAEVTASVLDAQGRLVAPLSSGRAAAGSHALTWDGRDASGQRAPGGVYFVRVQAGGLGVDSRRITIVR